MSRNQQLRLQVLLATILLRDPKHKLAQEAPSTSDIGDVIDRYDFEKYEEVCWLIEAIYCREKALGKERFSEEEGKALASQF